MTRRCYDYIKNYMAQNMPETPIGVGLTANYYIDADGEHPDYAGLCDAHFQQFVTGNAMKMDAMVNSDGTLNTATPATTSSGIRSKGRTTFTRSLLHR